MPTPKNPKKTPENEFSTRPVRLGASTTDNRINLLLTEVRLLSRKVKNLESRLKRIEGAVKIQVG